MSNWNRVLNVSTVVLTIGAVVAVGSLLKGEFSPGRPMTNGRVAEWREISGVGIRMGPQSSPVVITVFSDFTCPYCKAAAGVLARLQEKHPTELAVVYRHFPYRVRGSEAARASICADRAGRFQPLYHLLFDKQDSIGTPEDSPRDLSATAAGGGKSWESFAREAGVENITQFNRCMTDEKTATAIRDDVAAGKKIGVTVVPTFLVNDLRVDGLQSPELLDSLIQGIMRSRVAQR